MNTRITITEHGPMYTVDIHSTTMGSPISATMSDSYLYAVIDGMLWWAINRKLDSVVAVCMDQPAPTERDAHLQFGHAVASGKELVMHVFTTPWHEHQEERQARIVRYIRHEVPKLQPMVSHGPHAPMAKAELAEIIELCTLLEDRIAHSGEAMHGLQGMVTINKAAA
jgi:hypothetical protein